jgi:uncharacterized membrane protein
MTAALSPFGLTAPRDLRMGVWHPLKHRLAGATGAASAHLEGWSAEWVLPRAARTRYARWAVGLAVLFSVAALWTVYTRGGAIEDWPLAVALTTAALGWWVHDRRHMDDSDRIAIRKDHMCVEQRRAGHWVRTDFNPRWVRVEPEGQDGTLVRMHALGRSVLVGEFLAKQGRKQLAVELRSVLKHLCE